MIHTKTIAILGRSKDTVNYERFLTGNGFTALTTLSPAQVTSCQGLLLPGGGDITPAFFGEKNKGSHSIDTELDILQFQALDLCIQHHIPVLGICKGMQLINIAFGGTITQHMPQAALHQTAGRDLYHATYFAPGSYLSALYKQQNSDIAFVNSCHHQCINKLGNDLQIIQYSKEDLCPEAILHETLPILGLQWHPERLDPAKTSLPTAPLLSLFLD